MGTKKPISDKRRSRRSDRVKKIESKIIDNSELVPEKGVSEYDSQYKPKPGKEKKVTRLENRADRISEKSTRLLRGSDPTDQNLYGKGGYVPEGEGTDQNLYGKGGYKPEGIRRRKNK